MLGSVRNRNAGAELIALSDEKAELGLEIEITGWTEGRLRRVGGLPAPAPSAHLAWSVYKPPRLRCRYAAAPPWRPQPRRARGRRWRRRCVRRSHGGGGIRRTAGSGWGRAYRVRWRFRPNSYGRD